MTDSETDYLMMRARQEAALAAQASHPAAAAAHRHLSLRYSAKALIDLGKDTATAASAESACLREQPGAAVIATSA